MSDDAAAEIAAAAGAAMTATHTDQIEAGAVAPETAMAVDDAAATAAAAAPTGADAAEVGDEEAVAMDEGDVADAGAAGAASSSEAAAAATSADAEALPASSAPLVDDSAGVAAPAAAAPSTTSDSLAAMMEDGEDETLQDHVAAADDGADAAAAEGDEGAGDEQPAAAADAAGGEEEDLETQLARHCRDILASLSSADMKTLSRSQILDRLKELVGKKVIKRNKELATRVARKAAEDRLAELEPEGGEEGDADAGVEEDTRPPIGDDEEEDEDEAPKKKSKKRLRKAGGDSDAEDGDADEDYSEERSSKKSKKSASSKKSSSKKSSAGTGTAALLALESPKSAYQIFQSSERRRVRESHPDAGPHEINKLVSERWSSLDADSKAEFEALAQKQRADHAADLKRLKEDDPAAYESHMRAVKQREDDAVVGGGKKKKKRTEYMDDPEDGHDPDNPPAELSYFDSIVKSLKTKKQTKSDLNDEEQKEVEMAFLDKMQAAAKADEIAAQEGKPAMHKLKMLPQVQAQLSKSKVADRMLDNGLLRCLCAWIAPEADGSLPNVRLRTVIYQLLETLNVNETNLLNSEGLGKRIMRLWKSPEETLANRRLLESLMEKWMRPMLGLSTDYRKSQEVEEERAQEIFRRKAIIDAQPKALNYNPKRARIPEPARFDYAIRPQATEDHEAAEEEARENAKKPQESRKQLLTKRLDKMRQAGNSSAKPRFKVDITGRGSTGV